MRNAQGACLKAQGPRLNDRALTVNAAQDRQRTARLRAPVASRRSPAPRGPLCYDRQDLQTIFMASIQATRLKKGMLVKMDQDLFRVLELQHVTPGNLRGFVRIKLRNIRNGTLSDQKLRSEDTIERATLDEREMQYLYHDGDDYYFMDTSSFDQIHISSEALGESVNYLKAEMTIQVEFYGTEPVGIELPQTVDLKVTDTAPGIKGATASAQVKPATLETGLVVQVPPFVNLGDLIRVSTDTGEYLSRA
jgi:elongation factor P